MPYTDKRYVGTYRPACINTEDIVKQEALSDWVKAVNAVKIFGEWVNCVAYSAADIESIIALNLT